MREFVHVSGTVGFPYSGRLHWSMACAEGEQAEVGSKLIHETTISLIKSIG